MKYYRRYVGDYLKKTIKLSMTEHGAYGLLLDYYYAEERPIPLDFDEIYVICRATKPADRIAVRKVLERHFVSRSDGFHNERADEEIAAAQSSRINGSRGGRPGVRTDDRTGTLTGIETGIETGSATGFGGRTGHPPTTNHQPPEKGKEKATATFVLPEWIDPKTWASFVESRRKAKHPDITEQGWELIIKRLAEYRAAGDDPTAVLNQSIEFGYRSVFPLKAAFRGKAQGKEARDAAVREAAKKLAFGEGQP